MHTAAIGSVRSMLPLGNLGGGDGGFENRHDIVGLIQVVGFQLQSSFFSDPCMPAALPGVKESK